MCVTSQQSQTGAQPINEEAIIGHINIFLIALGWHVQTCKWFNETHCQRSFDRRLVQSRKTKSQHSNAVKYGALGVGDLHVTLIRAHKKGHLQFPF